MGKTFTDYNPKYLRRKIRKEVTAQLNLLNASTQCNFASDHVELENECYIPENMPSGHVDEHEDILQENQEIFHEHFSTTSDDTVVETLQSSLEQRNSSAGEEFSILDQRQNIIDALKTWIIKHNPTSAAVRDLVVDVLRPATGTQNIPCDKRTIFKVTRKKIVVEAMEPGIFYYFGIKNQLVHAKLQNSTNVVELIVGIDGLPIAKSNGNQFWPIMAYIVPEHENLTLMNSDVIIIGLYYGPNKPKDVNHFLEKFVEELTELNDGVTLPHCNSTIKVMIRAILADLPARAYILKGMYHGSYYACHRCTIKGKYFRNRICYPGTSFRRRRHVRHRTAQEHSVLCSLPYLSSVYDYPLDYMHCLCLGVMKKMLLIWFRSPFLKLRKRKTDMANRLYSNFKNSIPSEFARYCRPLSDLKWWKSTEFRLFLLYAGPAMLKKILPVRHFNHFMLLHQSSRILLADHSMEYIESARQMLTQFVNDFQVLYGSHRVSLNVHSLLHLTDDYQRFGNLNNVSCFPFENYLYKLKKNAIRQYKLPLQHVVRWYDSFKKKVPRNRIPRSSTKKIFLPNIQATIRTNSTRDSYVLMSDGHLVKVYAMSNGNITGRYFSSKKEFHSSNLIPGNPLGEFLIRDQLSTLLYCWPLQNVVRKYVLLKMDKRHYVGNPLLHTLAGGIEQ